MSDSTTVANAGMHPMLWDIIKIVIAMVLAWLVATWKAGRKAEKSVDGAAFAKIVSDEVSALREQIMPRLDTIESDFDALGRVNDRRFMRLEHVIHGVDGHGGMIAESERQRRIVEQDHEIVMHLSMVLRELYRHVTKSEPPAAPPALLDKLSEGIR